MPPAAALAPPLDLLRCPRCGGGLRKAAAADLTCGDCGHSYPRQGDLLDLRTARGPHHDLAEERARVAELLEWSQETNFYELVCRYIHERTGSTLDLKEIYIANRLGAVERGYRFLDILDDVTWRLAGRRRGEPRPVAGTRDPLGRALGTVLDIGCGSGGQLIAASHWADRLIGIDAAMTELALARRQLLDRGFERATLLAANGETLPLPDACIDTILMRDVVEHLDDQTRALQEAWRVLRPGGRFLFNSPNRYALWWPEPHVWLYWVGFLPRAWANGYCLRRKNMHYIGNRLLGEGELRSFLRRLEPRPAAMLLRGANPPGADPPRGIRWAWPLLRRGKFCNLPVVRAFAPEHMVLLIKPGPTIAG